LERKGKVSKEEALRLTNEIRNLINLGASEEHIIRHLKIGRATFFRYKRKVIKDIIKQNKTK
jgi:DNA invertase Pin-like site-specific DNA recombinase